MAGGSPALRLLARLKLRAWLRSLKRRFSTWTGAIFAFLGLIVTGFWVASLIWRSTASDLEFDPATRTGILGLAMFALTVMTLVSSLSYRGLYLPKDEIERLLAAPLSRADLVRYRLTTNSLRSLLFGIVLGLLIAPRVESPVFGFLGAFTFVLLMPILGQGVALLAGDAENRFTRLLKGTPLTILRIVVGVGVWFAMMAIFFAGDDSWKPPIGGDWKSLLEHPFVRIVGAPFQPWVEMMTATSATVFLPWFAFCIALTYALFDFVVRLPVDYREMALETSADVARRLSRMRSGRNLVSGSKVSKRTLGWNVPWVFGKSAFGAVAWIETVSILRKSRGTLMFSIFVLAMLTWFGSLGDFALESAPLAGPSLLASLGVLYLASGLRFDFRSALDRMEALKAWPLPAWKLFLATLLPEVALISLLVSTALLVRALLVRSFPLEMIWILLAVPCATLVWVALDNAIFLLAPVRFVPGEGAAMHHTGRTVVLMFVRMLALAFVAGAIGGSVVLGVLAARSLGLEPVWIQTAGVIVGIVVAVAASLALLSFGAWTLRRFDVSKEGVR